MAGRSISGRPTHCVAAVSATVAIDKEAREATDPSVRQRQFMLGLDRIAEAQGLVDEQELGDDVRDGRTGSG